MCRYIDIIFNDEVVGGDLLKPDGDEFLKECGVESALDRLKIIAATKMQTEGLSIQAEWAQEVDQFLQEIKLTQYKDMFREKEVHMHILLHSNDDVLKELGVQSQLDRVKIMIESSRKIKPQSTVGRRYTPADVIQFLINIRMEKYIENFRAHHIDGEYLSKFGHDALKALGVSRRADRDTIMNNFTSKLAENTS